MKKGSYDVCVMVMVVMEWRMVVIVMGFIMVIQGMFITVMVLVVDVVQVALRLKYDHRG